MNLIKRTIDIQENLKIVKIYVQSQWRVVLWWYHIFWQSSIQRGWHTQLCIIQICSNFYCWVCKNCFLLTQCTLLFGETSLLIFAVGPFWLSNNDMHTLMYVINIYDFAIYVAEYVNLVLVASEIRLLFGSCNALTLKPKSK